MELALKVAVDAKSMNIISIINPFIRVKTGNNGLVRRKCKTVILKMIQRGTGEPINLTSFVGKMWETLIRSRMGNQLDKFKLN